MSDYKYLEDGTPVTADELNSRFASLLGSTQGVNEITPDMLSLGALRHNQIPSLIGKRGETKEDLEGGFTDGTDDAFWTSTSIVPLTGRYTIDNGTTVPGAITFGDPIYRHTFNQPIAYTSASNRDADVLLLLANVHVNRFDQKADTTAAVFKASLRERRLSVAFRFTVYLDVIEADGTRVPSYYPMMSSVRGVSPGLTIDRNSGTDSTSGYPMATTTATYTGPDRLTFKDVPLRSVFRLADAQPDDRTIEVTSVTLEAVQFGSGCGATVVRVDKANLTAIPLHTKVDKHGGS